MAAHIKYDDTLAWCGATLDGSFAYVDAQAAAMNGKHGSATVACDDCTDVVIGYLIEGCSNDI